MSKLRIEIKHRWTGNIIFSYEKENNTLRDTVIKAVFCSANLSGADLSGSDLSDATLNRANLSEADLSGSDLSGSSFRSANLRSANLSDATLNRADLSGADLSGSDLSGSSFRSANLRSANLRSACLNEADLSGANMSEANLSRANLRDANLRDTDLRDTDLNGTNLREARLDYNDNYNGYNEDTSTMSEIVNTSKLKSILKSISTREIHNCKSSRWGLVWENLLVIDKWELYDDNEKPLKTTKDLTCMDISSFREDLIKFINDWGSK